ncbi:MAG: hypothetical protein ACRDPW_06265 [Mycobacteriales bacterium]
MLVRTFTSTWNLRTKIYAFEDVKVPIKGGITVPQILAGLGVAIIWIPFCLLIQLPSLIGNAGLATGLMIIPPVVALLKADTPLAHEKTTEEWLTAWLTRRSEPRRFGAFGVVPAGQKILLTGSHWVPRWGREEWLRSLVNSREGGRG